MINQPKIFIDAFRKENIHFFILMSCLFMQMLTISSAYRVFAYANILIVLIHAFNRYKTSEKTIDYNWVKYPLVFTLGFFVIQFIAVQNLVVIKEMRHIIVAVFLVIGLAMLDNKEGSYIRKNIFSFVIIIIAMYAVIQATSLWLFNSPYGTTKNPHYLALYSAICMIVALYCFFKAPIKLKWLSAACILLLGAFLIHSLSRPAWISLILSGLLLTCFLKRKTRFVAIMAMATTLLMLTLTNVGGFTDRSTDLIETIATEERVVIWQETWEMQADSRWQEWIVGHGMDSFEEDFKPYSSYHRENIDFNSPHNYLLELLYNCGWLGLSLAFYMFWLICRTLARSIILENRYKYIYMTLMAVLTSSVVFGSITLPFFTSYSMNVIAVVLGVMFNLQRLGNR